MPIGPEPLTGALARWQRVLVPGEWYESRGRRSVSDWVVDSVIFVAAVIVGVLTQASLWDRHGVLVDALDLAGGAVACLALWVRRSRPTAVAVAAAAGVFSPLAQGAALVAVFNTAMRGRGRVLVAVALLALVGSAIFPLLYPTAGPVAGQRFPGFLFTAVAFGWGILVRARREMVLSLRARAERVEAEQRRGAELARAAERQRIAREMHDVLAHRLSLLSVHAGALEFRPDAPPGELASAAAVIRSSASAALDELRGVLTVLREDTADTAPPGPALGQLPALLEESRAAQMSLRAHIDVPETGSLPEALGRTAYRVVQEGLTNARKHAPGAAVDVTVSGTAHCGLLVEVVSHPSPGAPTPSPPAPIPLVPSLLAPSGTGAGLIGLAERLALVGGELEHGTRASGEFVLRATMPGRA